MLSGVRASEPLDWIVCFHTEELGFTRFVPGRFKHVSAFAWCAPMRVWIFYDVLWHGTRIALVPPGKQFDEFSAIWTKGCALMLVRRRAVRRSWIRAGFWCVPAIKHLLGLRGCVARPDGLWRCCLQHGGIPIERWRQFIESIGVAATVADAGERSDVCAAEREIPA